MMHFVLLAAQPYRLTLRFNTGEVRAGNLEAFLRAKAGATGSAYRRTDQQASGWADQSFPPTPFRSRQLSRAF